MGQVAKTFRALASRNFRNLYFSSLIAHVGTWIHRAGQDWLVVEISDGSPAALGTVAGLQFLPLALFGLFAGLIVDRYDKRVVLAVATAVQLCASVTIGVLVLTNTITLELLYVLSFIFGTGTAFELPTRQAFVSELVPKASVSNAVSLNSLGFNVGRSIGPVLAGFLIATVWHHVGPLYIIHACTTLATLVVLPTLRRADYISFTPAPSGSKISEGIRYVLDRPDLSLVVVICIFAGLFSLNFQLLIAMLAKHDLGIAADGFGLLSSMIAIGAIAGATTAARLQRARLRYLVAAASLLGLLVATAALVPNIIAFGILMIPLGFCSLFVMATSNGLMQISSKPSIRGRLMSIYVVVIFSGTPVAAPIVGFLGDLIGVRAAIASGGLLLTLVSVLGSLLCARRLDVRPPWSKVDPELPPPTF